MIFSDMWADIVRERTPSQKHLTFRRAGCLMDGAVMKQSIVVSIVLLLSLFSIALADKKKQAPPSHDVAIKAMKFEPAQIQIAVGESVVWTNADDRDHTVVAK